MTCDAAVAVALSQAQPLRETIAADTESGWKARLELAFADRGDKTVLRHRAQQGPLAIQRPLYPEGKVCHTYPAASARRCRRR